MIYYFQLASYSVYVMLRLVGLGDQVFLFHTSYMVEGFFLKLPIIAADTGVFFILLAYTRKLSYASLFYLNPFIIYLSSAWGTYDSVMMMFLVAGFYSLNRGKDRTAGALFIISGLAKLFGFIPFLFLLIYESRKKHWRDIVAQLGLGAIASVLLFLPIIFSGGVQGFISGFVLRFLVAGAGQSGASWSLYSALQRIQAPTPAPIVWAVGAMTVAGFVVHLIKTHAAVPVILTWSIIAAVVLNTFTIAEPQWLSWLIPLGIIYAWAMGRESLARFAYFFGVVTTLLIMTLTQGTGYVLTGVAIDILGPLEGFYNGLAVYAICVTSLMLMFLGFVFIKNARFRWEILPITIIIYTQAYFWFVIERL